MGWDSRSLTRSLDFTVPRAGMRMLPDRDADVCARAGRREQEEAHGSLLTPADRCLGRSGLYMVGTCIPRN